MDFSRAVFDEIDQIKGLSAPVQGMGAAADNAQTARDLAALAGHGNAALKSIAGQRTQESGQTGNSWLQSEMRKAAHATKAYSFEAVDQGQRADGFHYHLLHLSNLEKPEKTMVIRVDDKGHASSCSVAWSDGQRHTMSSLSQRDFTPAKGGVAGSVASWLYQNEPQAVPGLLVQMKQSVHAAPAPAVAQMRNSGTRPGG